VTPWKVEWTGAAQKDLLTLDASTLARVRAALRRLAETGEGDVKKLQGLPGYRLRVGSWRLFFLRESNPRTLRIYRVKPRKDAY
jgi:mRNA interferase RelE/StbE